MLKFEDSKANYKFPKVVYYLNNQKSENNYITRALLHFENIFHIYTIPTRVSSFSIADLLFCWKVKLTAATKH